MSCCCGIQVSFATCLTDLSRNVLKDDGCDITFKCHSSCSCLGFSLLADNTFHGFLLLKSASHLFGSGTYTVITIFLWLVVSVATTTWIGRVSHQPSTNSLG